MQYAVAQGESASWFGRILGLSLFYKVLIANSSIVVVGAIFGTGLTLRAAQETGAIYSLVALFAVIGTLSSIAVNWFVLRAALRPLLVLEKTVDEVRRGNFSVRVKKVGVGDPNIDMLTDTFNGMLDAVERYRAQIHEMSVRALSAQEEERKRISRELHDDTAQALTAQLLRLEDNRSHWRDTRPNRAHAAHRIDRRNARGRATHGARTATAEPRRPGFAGVPRGTGCAMPRAL